jgi:uncharacterized protein YndB with AHSA1/START domain
MNVNSEMLIRRPVADVFQAFVDPAVTSRFWFTKASGKLEAGKRIRWDWEMYGVHDDVEVHRVETNARIVYDWSFPDSTRVEWRFSPRRGATMVSVTETIRTGDSEAMAARALDLSQGYAIVLCAAKAWLEHGVELNAVADKSPDQNVAGWESGA